VVVFMVSYKRGLPFDETYYFERHLPLAARVLARLGLVRAEILRDLMDPTDGSPGPDQLVAHLYFPSSQVLADALSNPALQEVMNDIRNFYPGEPTFQVARVEGAD
jgi:uncharacterized protein (TIGR02118 family)